MSVQCCILLFTVVHFTSAAGDCRVYYGQKGDCKPITQCPSILSFTEGTPTASELQFLRNHYCGRDGNVPRVCCPKTPRPTPEGWKLLNSTDCGPTVINHRIVGGEEAGLGEFPWLALLEYTNSNGSKFFGCGGTLISKRYVLTAAHCITHSLTSVRLGEHNTETDPDCISDAFGKICALPPINIEIKHKIVHESYLKEDNVNLYNDIALIRLKEDVTFTEYIIPICLPTIPEEHTETYIGKELFTAGFGKTENTSMSPVKLKAKIPGRDFPFCETTYRQFRKNLMLRETQMCVGGEKGIDSCKGDSGGPLMAVRTVQKGKIKEKQWYIAGIVSAGTVRCGMPNWGAVYTRVSKYITWIASNIK